MSGGAARTEDEPYRICGFAQAQIADVWPHVARMIGDATARSNGRFTPAHIRRFLLERRMQLWAAHDGEAIHAVCVTEIVTWPTGLKEGALVLAGGADAKGWIRTMQETLEAWAADAGCRALRVRGRRGWQRLLTDYRWTGVTLEKAIWIQNSPPAP